MFKQVFLLLIANSPSLQGLEVPAPEPIIALVRFLNFLASYISYHLLVEDNADDINALPCDINRHTEQEEVETTEDFAEFDLIHLQHLPADLRAPVDPIFQRGRTLTFRTNSKYSTHMINCVAVH